MRTKVSRVWRAVRARRAVFVAALVLAGVLAVAGVLFLPQLMVDVRGMQLAPRDRLDAEEGIRGSVLQALGGLVLVVGLFFTARGFRLNQEGHITDRYSKSVEQLGNASLDVRIGGIFALERIARDSPPDRQTVVEVLTAYVREHTRKDWRTPKTDAVTADVQAALTVLGRRPAPDHGHKRLDFYHAGLRGARLDGADWRNAIFDYSYLAETVFAGSKLDNADLSFCRAEGVGFGHTSARGVGFVNASYKHCWFIAADLTDADFYGCDLTGSDFGRRYAEEGVPPLPPAILANARMTKATLTQTNLRGVDLSTVRGLLPEQLREAITDKNTVVPQLWGGGDED